MRTAFFGGTFDPPHTGHLELARHVLEADRTDRILFVPAYDPPHKTGRTISPFENRMAMLEMLLAAEPAMLISDIEQRAGLAPSYSFKILKLLEKEFPGDRLQLLIGGDSLAALHTWFRAHDLLAEYEIICYPRRGYAFDRDRIRSYWNEKETGILSRTLLQMPFFDVSSTAVRNAVKTHKECKKLNENILQYIKNKGLYL
ncbi:MAG: nicotinate (nicotinamide) nucleotide adenylyltransferase [Victivallales bacterium]|nr:nicotinate (nicotinamide) nucleotide adenylyltransferase [Victivallales bacterium]